MPRRPSCERGIALPVTLLIIALVTVMLATAFVRVQADRRIAESSGDMVDALAVAQSGLQTYLATPPTVDGCDIATRPLDGDSVRVNVTGGYADVVANVVLKPADTMATWTYITRARGTVIEPTLGADPQAVRVVAQFAEWQRGHVQTIAAFTAANGLARRPDGSGDINGSDRSTSCTQPDIGAVYLPQNEQPASWSDFTLTGPIITAPDGPSVAFGTGIDWAATIGTVTPDYTSIVSDPSYPVILVNGDASVGSSLTGYGTLVVTGSLSITGGDFRWYGVILVGGRIRFDGSDHHFDGILIGGLNEQLGVSPSQTEIGGTTLRIHYDSREIRRALRRWSGWVPVRNAWVDNWATY